MAKKTDGPIVTKISNQGTFFLPRGGVMTDLHLAAFAETLTRRTVVDQIIYPDDHGGLPCVAVGSRYLLRVDALAEYRERHEQPLTRQRKKGGNRCGNGQPCKRSA